MSSKKGNALERCVQAACSNFPRQAITCSTNPHLQEMCPRNAVQKMRPRAWLQKCSNKYVLKIHFTRSDAVKV